MLQSQIYAEDVGTDVWEFSLDLAELQALKLTTSDLRWLVMKGYVEHARETSLPGEPTRSFRKTAGLSFGKRTCFVITPEGIGAAQRWIAADEIAAMQLQTPATAANEGLPVTPVAPSRRVVPHWDADLQELRVNGVIIKQFKVPAPNQEMILAAFQEETWPARIDDPLPPHAEQDPKRRLHDTIVSLNRNHKTRLIRFMGDGSGQGVRWTVVTEDQDGDDA
ncbi:MAG: hypothetical protein QM775_31715 [Pirellulales bacterium]